MAPPPAFNPGWITGDNINQQTVDWASNIGFEITRENFELGKPIATSQIRKFFGEVKRIQADFEKYKNDIPLLQAKLAYAVGRQSGREKKRFEYFYNQLLPALQNINGERENYMRFVKILESIVAFHKFHGGKENP